MVRRRAKGEGTIWRRTDGLWVAQITLPTGKRKAKYGRTQKEVKDWLHSQKEALRVGLWVESDNVNYGDFLDRYMDDVAAHTLRPRTLESYHYLIDKHIKPDLGHVKLSQLRPEHLQNLYSLKLNQGLSRRTVQYIHAVIHKSLNQALKWGIVARNVADVAEPPSPQKTTPSSLTPAQVNRLLAAAREDRLYPLYVLAISTGMRQGELLGLQWGDIDFENGEIHVNHSLQLLLGKGLVLTEPKTEASRRSIKIPPIAVEALKTIPNTGGYVFKTSNGTPFSPRNLLRYFHRILEKADLPMMRFHDLRHTFASLLLNENVHPKIVQEMLGHSTISLTLNTYSHLLPERQQEAADKLEKLMRI